MPPCHILRENHVQIWKDVSFSWSNANVDLHQWQCALIWMALFLNTVLSFSNHSATAIILFKHLHLVHVNKHKRRRAELIVSDS